MVSKIGTGKKVSRIQRALGCLFAFFTTDFMNVQREIENLANQLEMLKSRVQEQGLNNRENIANFRQDHVQGKWKPLESRFSTSSPKMSLTELQSFKEDEDDLEDLEVFLEKVKEICGQGQEEEMDDLLNVINDVVASSQDTVRIEEPTPKEQYSMPKNERTVLANRLVNLKPEILKQPVKIEQSISNVDKTELISNSGPRFSDANRRPNLPRLQYQTQIESFIDVGYY